jgi:hypothetical protein
MVARWQRNVVDEIERGEQYAPLDSKLSGHIGNVMEHKVPVHDFDVVPLIPQLLEYRTTIDRSA